MMMMNSVIIMKFKNRLSQSLITMRHSVYDDDGDDDNEFSNYYDM